MEWDLQVKLRAQKPPLGRATPHCVSTLTGPFGLGTFGLGGSSFLSFFFFGSLSAPSSAFRFFDFLGPSVAFFEALFLGGFLVESGSSTPSAPSAAAIRSSTPSPSLSFSFSFSSAASLALAFASLASFFFRARSFFFSRHNGACDTSTDSDIGFLQCLQFTIFSELSPTFWLAPLTAGEPGEGLLVVPAVLVPIVDLVSRQDLESIRPSSPLLSVSFGFVFFAIDFLRLIPPLILSFFADGFLLALGSCRLISELDATEALDVF